MRKSFVLALMAAAATPVAAQSGDARPASCQLVATVQDDHCAVSNHFACSGPVAHWTEVTHGNGAVETHSRNADFGTVKLVMPGGTQIRSESRGDHPRVAVAKGSSRSTERAIVTSGGSSQSATMVTNYTYSGEQRKLAGEVFDRLSYVSDLNFPEAGSRLQTSGSMLFSEGLNLLVLERDVSDGEGGPARSIKLKSLALDGQKGFGATRPRYGCN